MLSWLGSWTILAISELPMRWTSPVCPRPPELAATIEAELSGSSPNVVHAVDVDVVRRDEGLLVDIAVTRGETVVRRAVPVATCDLVPEAVVLVVGLAAADEGNMLEATKQDAPPLPLAPVVPEPPNGDAEWPTSAPRSGTEATRPAPPERLQNPTRAIGRASLGLGFDAGLRVGFGGPPGASFLVALGPAWPRFFIDLGFRYDTPATFQSPRLDGAGMRVSWLLGSARVGFVIPLGRRWTLPLYVRCDAGVLRGASFGVSAARVVAVPWLTPGLGAAVRWQLRPRWALSFGAELSVAIFRHVFVVGDAGVSAGETEHLGGMVRVGVAFRWP